MATPKNMQKAIVYLTPEEYEIITLAANLKYKGIRGVLSSYFKDLMIKDMEDNPEFYNNIKNLLKLSNTAQTEQTEAESKTNTENSTEIPEVNAENNTSDKK